ncbi:DUF4935 domain-containing protein (plasmid) [Bacillus sp. JAS24-2]|uniref:PIN domain-containing protein n=1 Tax=Bacillus sp. JAS24-2 TaxID=2217832 RepID=UPI0011EF97BD|nr:PIN domain-containing protein [Bacillus sp. JAS24-2]QEL82651.1 DUF4935 domain-containing protein [Bacillus sp. JAS24-2]
MNIFIDSNIIYRDPFLTKGFNNVLNRLAKHEDVTLFISKAVYMEVLRGHKVFLEEQLKAANKIHNKISRYLIEDKQNFTIDIKLEDLLQDFENQYLQLQEEAKLKIIDFDKDVLEFVVEIDMYEKSPFIKKNEVQNKSGEMIPYKKKEIRDAIIWYSYQVYIKNNNLDNCYFLSNNTNEFGDENAKDIPNNEPYNLHPELNTDLSIIPYKTTQGFLTHNDEKVKELFKDINELILSEELSEKIEEELNNGFAEELIDKYFKEQILSETQNFISNKQPDDIHDDYFMAGYIDPNVSSDILNVQVAEIELYGGELTVALDIEVDADVDVYLFNQGYDDRNEKFQYYATDTIKVEESIIFIIPINTEKELIEETFSLKEYIGDVEPNNLNIEFLQWTNTNHRKMFDIEPDFEEIK